MSPLSVSGGQSIGDGNNSERISESKDKAIEINQQRIDWKKSKKSPRDLW